MPLRLLHLSDIHFGGYGPVWDDDEDQREQVIEEVRRSVAGDGKIDGILVGGDIAYSAQPEQYDDANTWLDKLVAACGCEPEDVWVVPGNHDVNWDTVKASPILQEFRDAIRAQGPQDLYPELKRRFAADPAAAGLLCTLDEYNAFALSRGCALTAEKFYWQDETLRVDDVPVLLWGMNSVLVSDASDTADDPANGTAANLVVGLRQARVRRLTGVVRIALVHHPPNWLADWDEIAPFVSRAHVVLFGHEHMFETSQPLPGGTVHVRAGAVGPERDGEAWVPTFNVLTLGIETDQLHVEVAPHVWAAKHTTFVAAETGRLKFTVDLEPVEAATSIEPSGDDEDIEPDGIPANATPLLAPSEPANAPSQSEAAKLRKLVYRFLGQPATRRDEIARSLGVDDPADEGLPPSEESAQVLMRIRDLDLIDALEKELSK